MFSFWEFVCIIHNVFRVISELKRHLFYHGVDARVKREHDNSRVNSGSSTDGIV